MFPRAAGSGQRSNSERTRVSSKVSSSRSITSGTRSSGRWPEGWSAGPEYLVIGCSNALERDTQVPGYGML